MKTKEQIQEKIDEVRLFEGECENMAICIATGMHPKDYPVKFETFDDLDAAYEFDSDFWQDKSVMYFRVLEALEWVLKD